MAEKHSRLVTLLQVLFILMVFVAGIVISRLSATSSNINQYFGTSPELILSTNRASVASPEPRENCTVPVPRACDCDCPDCSSMDSFLHPRNLTHSMSDAELLWRAAMVSRAGNHPFARVPRVAFMFLTRGPLPMLPLWEKFFEGQKRELHSIYVHAPPGYKLNVSGGSPFHGRQIPSQVNYQAPVCISRKSFPVIPGIPFRLNISRKTDCSRTGKMLSSFLLFFLYVFQNVKWGTVELFDAERRLLGNALLDFSNERFVLLSESCIPVYNFSTVYSYLTGSKHSFVDSFDEPTRYGRGRYSRNMFPHINLRQWRKGSQWFELNRDLATYVVSETKYYSLFRKFCKPACYPDEHYIPTYLNMFHGSKNSNRSVTWVDWSFRAPHPASFEKANVTADFIRSIRSNGTLCPYNSGKTHICHLFARKFAPSALEPLLELSSTVMEY